MATGAPPNSSLRAVDDLALVRRIAEQRVDALAELFDRHAPLLLGVARRIVGGAFEAEEVLQETFLHVWAQAAAYDPARASVATWLALVARGRALERVRARGPRAGAPAAGGEPGAGPAAESHPVGAALAALDPEERRLLELAFWEGRSPREIAARDRTELEAVQARALAAFRRLRQALREQIRERM